MNTHLHYFLIIPFHFISSKAHEIRFPVFMFHVFGKVNQLYSSPAVLLSLGFDRHGVNFLTDNHTPQIYGVLN